MNLVVVTKIITGKLALSALAGPLAIFDAAAKSFAEGLLSYIGLIAVISIAVGFINLLPFPGLDGAQLVYLLIEKISGKALSLNFQLLPVPSDHSPNIQQGKMSHQLS